MGSEVGFDGFALREERRLRILVGALAVDPPGGRAVLTETWLIARHHWPWLGGQARSDLWLLTLALRMLRRTGRPAAAQQPIHIAPVPACLQALDPAVRPAAVLDRFLGLGVEETALVLDLPEELVREQLRQAADALDGPGAGEQVGAPAVAFDLAELDDEYQRRCADPGSRAALDALVGAAVSYLEAEEALRRDDLPLAESGFAVAAAAGFADAARRCAAVRRMVPAPDERPSLHDELVVAAAAGDERAMRELLQIVVPLVTRYCRARATTVRDSALSADDIAQEAVAGIVAALPRFVPGSRPFLAFVMRVAANKVYDAHRTSGRLRTNAMPEGVEWVDPAPGPAEHVERFDDVATARQLLGRLTERQRDVLVMRLVCEMTADEVADVLGATPGAVRVAQHRALATLRQGTGKQRRRLAPPRRGAAAFGADTTAAS